MTSANETYILIDYLGGTHENTHFVDDDASAYGQRDRQLFQGFLHLQLLGWKRS
jgi:hypothetical protein